MSDTIKIDGHEFPVAGTLSAFPQCDELRRAYRMMTA